MPTSVAVIDIGSNSVRLVVYDALKRMPMVLLNEKVLCGMARDIERTGHLHPEGRALAEHTLERFATLLEKLQARTVLAFATAAVRDAKDGKDFLDFCRKRLDLKIRILSGEDEARYSALGLLGSFHHVHGVVGDLGGGSMELVQVNTKQGKQTGDNALGKRISLPVGPLRLRDMAHNNRATARTIVDTQLAKFDLGNTLKGKDFYAIGGGFRALAKVHIVRTRYPLNILHGYCVSPEELMPTVDMISRMTPARLRAMPSISEGRVDTLSYTALVMERLLHLGKPRHIWFSVHGVREGTLYDRLPEEEKIQDGLIASATGMILTISPRAKGEWITFGKELANWMQPLYRRENPGIHRLRLAACILSHLAWYEHTAYRAENAFRWVLDSPLPSITHSERVFLALCLYHRYKSELEFDDAVPALALLDENMVYRAKVIGHALRLGYEIAGGACGILPSVRMVLRHHTLCLETGTANRPLLGIGVEKRLSKLASVLGYDYSL
ncbi:MAG: Ppx/GppA family phosphatase [Rickettsiales bacterium]|nr:Ppx/GppA family phosphatase [Rickettsiales bacterium]